ncbi:TauD/TfdA family dioxygenase [Verrucomicrobiales bacterium BCK34]|nr:TauD/TfdA family dioxygenase [Verrucomicrobiales bacterium BCK34]
MIHLREDPTVWKGDELVRRDDWIQDFETADPGAIRDQLENGSGAILLRGFPLSTHTKDSARDTFREWTGSLGTLLSQNESGDTVFDVSDAGFAKDDPRTRGPNTKNKLSFHTDRCDVIAFLCWRQARSGGENQLISSKHLYNEIAARRPDLLEILKQPFVYKRHTVDLANALSFCEQPIFSFTEGHFACSFLRVLIDRAHADPELPDLSPEQIEAMDFLEAVADEPGQAFHFRQEPGDILLLNNWITLHRRSSFEDHDAEEEKRCLFRIWLSMPNSRPIDHLFEANFGSTKAGAVRGGFRTG